MSQRYCWKINAECFVCSCRCLRASSGNTQGLRRMCKTTSWRRSSNDDHQVGRSEKKVSYLCYPTFDTEDHPGLISSDVVDLASISYRVFKYRLGDTQPVLHRKELFLHKSDPRTASFAAITQSEERLGLFSSPQLIGTRGGWNQEVAKAHARRTETMQ